MIDGGLRQLVRRYLADFHWAAVETGGTGRGIPDDNFCHDGVEGWVEHKIATGWKVDLRPEQVGWIERRRRSGGRVFILVRRTNASSECDDVYLFAGDDARKLKTFGLPRGKPLAAADQAMPLAFCPGYGPQKWDWERIRDLLLRFDFLSLSKGAIESRHIKGDTP